MKLSRKDHEFNNPRICHIIPKHIDLERVMINLYMLLKYDAVSYTHLTLPTSDLV